MYYHKINAPFKRHMEGKKKGRLIPGDWSVAEFEYLAGNQWEFTEKVDGTNIVISWEMCKHPCYGGRTSRSNIPEPLLNHLQSTLTAQRFERAIGDGFNGKSVPVLLYGEGYGPKIQDGDKYRDDVSFVLFDVKIGNFWLDRSNVNDVASKLGIDAVPVLGQGTLQDAIDIVSSGITFNKAGAIKRWGRGGLKSAWGDFEAEGIIARPLVPMFDRHGNRIITKIKGVDFK